MMVGGFIFFFIIYFYILKQKRELGWKRGQKTEISFINSRREKHTPAFFFFFEKIKKIILKFLTYKTCHALIVILRYVNFNSL